MSECDLLIKNARIVDGTGSPAYRGALSVEGERIAAIGLVEGELHADAGTVIDAGVLVAAPGFIDVHNHGDLSILHHPRAEGFLHQGITTFVGGNCGTSPGPYGGYVDQAYFLYDLWWRLAPHCNGDGQQGAVPGLLAEVHGRRGAQLHGLHLLQLHEGEEHRESLHVRRTFSSRRLHLDTVTAT
jgi:hypothetical protein